MNILSIQSRFINRRAWVLDNYIIFLLYNFVNCLLDNKMALAFVLGVVIIITAVRALPPPAQRMYSENIRNQST